MANNGETVSKDKGYKKILAEIESADSASVSVGWFAGAVNDDTGESIAQYAFFNEFGTQNAPARPSLTATFDKNKAKYKRIQRQWWNDVMIGRMTVRQVMNQIGLIAVSDVRKKITATMTPRNADSTIKKKGANNPLIDNGHMKNNVWFESNVNGVKQLNKPQ